MVADDTQREALHDAVEAIADRIEAEKGHLTDLDSAIGDADHGANMHRGMQAVLEELDDLDGDAGGADDGVDAGEADDADRPGPQEIAQTVGRTLIAEVGGAAGPLYGGSVMSASTELADGVTAESSVAFAEAYLETVQDRGDARVGDKTMVDALTPAVHTYRKSIEHDDLPPLAALAKAVDAAERGVRFTTPIRASKGRASYLGWRSVGHQDPGATSTLFILEELLGVAEEYLEAPGAEVERDATSPTVPDEAPEEGSE